MSTILDALRKLDHEKSLRRGTTPDIGAEILKAGPPRSGRRFVLYLVIVSIVTAAITYAVLARFNVLPKPSPPYAGIVGEPNQPAVPIPPPSPSGSTSSRSASGRYPVQDRKTSSSVSQPAPVQKASPSASLKSLSTRREDSPSPSPSSPAPTLSLPGSIQQASPPPQPRGAVRDLPDGPGGVDTQTHRTVENNAPATSGAEKKAAQQVLTEPVPGASERAEKPQRVAPPESGDPPAMRISGIVWSEDPSQRVAVINGMTLWEGDSIEGVKIVQILPARVRFLRNTLPFEILLGSSTIIKY